MKKNIMRRNLRRTIKYSITRYIAIVAIIALGSAIFVGLRTTKSDMINTGQRYMDEQNMFDIRLLSTYGWSREHPDKISSLPGIEAAEGVISLDAIIHNGISESAYKLYSLPQQINQVYLHSGRLPESPNECLADVYSTSEDMLGKQITVSSANNADTLDSLSLHNFTVVGLVSSPLYMDMSRGNTTLGNGTLAGFYFMPVDSFNVDYYSEIVVTLQGDRSVYTDAYHDRVESESDRLMTLLEPVADERYKQVLNDARDSYADGLAEYEKGLAEYKTGKQDTFDALDEARKELQDAEKEINENRNKLDTGKLELDDNEEKLNEGKLQLADSKTQLAEAKEKAYSEMAKANADLMKGYQEVDDALSQVNDGIAKIDDGISQIESGLSQLKITIAVTDSLLTVARTTMAGAQSALDLAVGQGADADSLADLKNSLTDAQKSINDYEAQLAKMKAQEAELNVQLLQLQQQKESLLQTKSTLNEAKSKLDQGAEELENSRKTAEDEFAVAEAKIVKAEQEMEAGALALEVGRKEIEEGYKQLEEAVQQLEAGWKEYNEGFIKASKELSDAWIQLEDGRLSLKEAKESIDKMEAPDLFALGRVTNVGYVALENNSDIVEGVSAVFPAFFLLIAALVCITTMTRMVEDERTQIGTLKALGYSGRSVMGKYLGYAGSAAVIGCVLGVVAGSIVFPLILWDAYQIIMTLGDYFLLRIDWPLCISVVTVYTAVTLAVTWYCCHRSLKEVPAELIRPKPPTTGKSIFLEKLPFWNGISFLNKVMIRNIFRYRQRLIMMLIGVGGCTALLLAGFGIRDSIGELADIQFDEIVLYDHEVRFSDELTSSDMAAFTEAFSDEFEDIMFYHQSSMELYFDDQMTNVNFIAADHKIGDFIDFHKGKQTVDLPGDGEAIISIGMAERLGISEGDSITLRDEALNTLSLNVNGIYDNNVYNYVVVTPRTVQQQWGKAPEIQMACIHARQQLDMHELGASISMYDGVMSVTVSEDVRSSVGQMLNAMDLIVITVVICASLLAVIVTYNLTNINITERIREIATIKVLGFRAWECASYVFKENMLLTAIGSLLGSIGGRFLLDFIISKIQVDMVWLSARLGWSSYLFAVLITLLSAVAVDFVLYFKLKQINMAEALKSVE